MPVRSRRPRWGLLGAGRICHDFALALKDIGADVVACAARELPRAEELLRGVGYDDARAYGSYEDLVSDARVDVVYISTLHVAHKEHSLLCLRAGKHVFCEKPLAMNECECRDVLDEANGRGLMCLEAMWTRYFPIVQEIRDLLARGAIGQVRAVTADIGFVRPDDGRGWRSDLGGGALLWNGVYALQWAMLAFGAGAAVSGTAVGSCAGAKTASASAAGLPDRMSAVMELTPESVDSQGAATLRWPGGGIASLTWSHAAVLSNEVRIAGSEGYVKVHARAHCPVTAEVGICRDGQQALQELHAELPASARSDFRFPRSQGLQHEARAVEALLQPLLGDDGRGIAGPSAAVVAEVTASSPFPPAESLLLARITDELRRQGGVRYSNDEAARQRTSTSRSPSSTTSCWAIATRICRKTAARI